MLIRRGLHKSDELFLSIFDIIKLLLGIELKASGIKVMRKNPTLKTSE